MFLIRTYRERDGDKVKVFFSIKDNNVTSVTIGNQSVPVDQGFQFYVDDFVADQIHKCELYIDGLTPKLRVKEGEQLFVPEECEAYKKQKEIEELEQRLQQLKAD